MKLSVLVQAIFILRESIIFIPLIGLNIVEPLIHIDGMSPVIHSLFYIHTDEDREEHYQNFRTSERWARGGQYVFYKSNWNISL
jgi:hypothetical protein